MSTEPRKTQFPRDNRDSVLDRRENIQGVPGTQHPHLPPQDDRCESVLSGPQCIKGEHKTEQKL
jgi:hypothetical protein